MCWAPNAQPNSATQIFNVAIFQACSLFLPGYKRSRCSMDIIKACLVVAMSVDAVNHSTDSQQQQSSPLSLYAQTPPLH